MSARLNKTIRNNWADEEDKLLTAVVEKGFKFWKDVSQQIPGRNSKQCRERWQQNLNPSLHIHNFTREEDMLLVNLKVANVIGSVSTSVTAGGSNGIQGRAQIKKNTNWSLITKHMSGRSSQQVKARYELLKRRVLKNSELFSEQSGECGDDISDVDILELIMKEHSFDDSSNNRYASSFCDVMTLPTPFSATKLTDQRVDLPSAAVADVSINDPPVSKRKRKRSVLQSSESNHSPELVLIGAIRGQWRTEEDRLLTHLVSSSRGSNNWVHIASELPGRSSKQCRERWVNYLDPRNLRTKYSASEDELLQTLHSQVGNKWAYISQRLPGRSEQSVKARYRSMRLHAAGCYHRKLSIVHGLAPAPLLSSV